MPRSKEALGEYTNHTTFKTDNPVAFDDNNWPIFGYNENGNPVCYSNKRNGKGRCMNPVRYPNGRCRMHGGKTPKGLEHHTFRGSLYAGKMNRQAAKILVDSINDPDYLSLREELGINTGMIARTLGALKRIDADEHTWGEILTMAQQLEQLAFDESLHNMAIAAQNPKLIRLLNLTERLVKRAQAGYDSKRLNEEIARLMESRRKLVETDLKRIQVTKHNMPADQVMSLFENFTKMVLSIWSRDSERLEIFAAKVDELMGNAVDGSELLKALTDGKLTDVPVDAEFEEDEDEEEAPLKPAKIQEEEKALKSFLVDNSFDTFLEENLETGRIEVSLEKMAASDTVKRLGRKLNF